MNKLLYLLFIVPFFFIQCTSSEDNTATSVYSPPADARFVEMPTAETGIDFVNEVENTRDFNIFSYRNFYNGGGVAIGDINNDGLPDIYFTNNKGKNKLFLNKGDFKFEDISQPAGVAGERGWSTGVVMVDINADGLLDIYVCNAGYVEGDDQANELFINNGDLTFTEKAAEYGLNQGGYTTHAAFFDYDLDGDLDVYILNNSFMPVNTLNYSNKRELYAEDWPVRDFLKGGGDKLLRNEDGKFIDVTKEANIFGSLIGFGLGVTVGDVNGDLWPDLYISNDFFERDYLYINQQDGTFQEEVKDWMEHLSLFSMGADMADINNDGYPEIFATDMLPDEDYRLKTTTTFENYNIYQLKQQRDFYHQYMQNTLQLNNQDNSFSEIAYFSGVSSSDWSWGALMFDADNDGLRDIYVCNGVYQDVTNQDFINFFANEIIQKMALTGKKEEIEKILEEMPSTPVRNRFFHNNGDLTFDESSEAWGFGEKTFSNGAAYGDLDNDGDLDLVVNNLNQQALVYQNKTDSQDENHYLSVKLSAPAPNTYALGAKVFVYQNDRQLNFQLVPSRGFQSSVDYKMVFGLGESGQVDSVQVIWPDRTSTMLHGVKSDQVLNIDYATVEKQPYTPAKAGMDAKKLLLQEASLDVTPHTEDRFIDFFQEGLTMRMISREGPKTAVGDVNGDGRDDIYLGGASGWPGQMLIQKGNSWQATNIKTFERTNNYEDTAAALFDADGDGDLDLFVGSGGNNMPVGHRYMQDRLYINDGRGNFEMNPRALTASGFNTSVAVPLDVDQDGDLDLFVGSRSIPSQYGSNPPSFMYINDGKGTFRDEIETYAPELASLGMITDAVSANLMGDETPELIVTGEWMAPAVFQWDGEKYARTKTNLDDKSGWWYAVETADLDGDGDLDLVLGNRGENFYFTGTPEAPAKLWLSDFDDNGTTEKIITRSIDGRDMPIPMKDELTGQIVSLKKQNLKHAEYAQRSIDELFSAEVMAKVKVKEGNFFRSIIALNDGNGQFTIQELPAEVQFSCVCDIYCGDLNGDQLPDLMLGGNDGGFTPQFSKLDASFGHVLINSGNGQFNRIPQSESGFFVRGDIRQLVPVAKGGQPYVLVGINNEAAQLWKINK
ncbi:VCBS repeat-containing protein [Lewinella cohaerens]|uniref:VCBS repeat-containing protein n=1 Tax=Lewinella cohaerens TaxID=70995 RepID=UPI00036225FB|nr:VCBS repeat-containing protein [Lewinella cohaerens]